MRPLFSRAIAEHEAAMAEAGAGRYLRKEGWLKLYRSTRAFSAEKEEMALADDLGIPFRALDTAAARARAEPRAGVSARGAVGRGRQRHQSAGGDQGLRGAIRDHRRRGDDGRCTLASPQRWRLAGRNRTGADRCRLKSSWRLDHLRRTCLAPLGINLPLAIKRGYHRHFRPAGNAALRRPVLDEEVGYCLAPMEQGIRLTTGIEFAARDAPPTPVQLHRLLPAARGLFPLGEPR